MKPGRNWMHMETELFREHEKRGRRWLFRADSLLGHDMHLYQRYLEKARLRLRGALRLACPLPCSRLLPATGSFIPVHRLTSSLVEYASGAQTIARVLTTDTCEQRLRRAL